MIINADLRLNLDRLLEIVLVGVHMEDLYAWLGLVILLGIWIFGIEINW